MSALLAEPFMRFALAGGALVSGLCAVLGVFLVLRRMVFVAVALSELAACGVALGMFLGFAPPFWAAVTCLAGIGMLAVPAREELISRDSLVGAVYAFSAALALILMAINPMARAHGLDLFAGDLLYTGTEHLVTLGILALVTGGAIALFHRRLLFAFYDRETALSLGLPVRRLELGFLIAVALVIAFSLRVAGVIFVFASLVLPPVFGLALGGRILPALVIAPVGAVLSSVVGLYVSYRSEDIPAGPAIVIVYGAVAAAAVLLRAVVRRAWRRTGRA